MSHFPQYQFGNYEGPAIATFAWLPTRLWDGRIAWLRPLMRRRVIKHSYLDGPDWAFWSYTD